MNNENLKFCKDCKHYQYRGIFPARCLHPNNYKYNLENGEKSFIDTAFDLRLRWYHKCGKDGKWFEKSNKNP